MGNIIQSLKECTIMCVEDCSRELLQPLMGNIEQVVPEIMRDEEVEEEFEML